MIKNDFSKLKAINTFFNLGLIVDQTLAHRFLRNVKEEDRNMGKAVSALAQHFGLIDFFKKGGHGGQRKGSGRPPKFPMIETEKDENALQSGYRKYMANQFDRLTLPEAEKIFEAWLGLH